MLRFYVHQCGITRVDKAHTHQSRRRTEPDQPKKGQPEFQPSLTHTNKTNQQANQHTQQRTEHTINQPLTMQGRVYVIGGDPCKAARKRVVWYFTNRPGRERAAAYTSKYHYVCCARVEQPCASPFAHIPGPNKPN